jgi:hypothetical protein
MDNWHLAMISDACLSSESKSLHIEKSYLPFRAIKF